ncbi:ABC transporter substrate-binding protein [Cohnella panacarvi]|uniref:ABC transporter substrate-binding protein n=1 Tax=Cohnella panacarvi TaxID=400776 RepID=UPI000478D5A0|nr:extracellular solute-binding protein [Cohnella panacarvi]
MKKALNLGTALLLTTGLLAACGNNSDKVASSATASSSASAPAEKAEPKEVELNVFIGAPRFKDQFDKYFEKFKAKELAEKNIDVTVNLEMPAPEQARDVLKARLASGDAPDVFDLHATQDIPSYYKAGYLTDLSDQTFVGKLYDGVKQTVTLDGKVLAVPMESLSWGYLYNKKMFADNGITPPQTLDEMKAVVEKLKAAGQTPFLLAYQESWVPQLMTALSIGGTVSSEQPDWIAKMNKGEASYNDIASIFDIIDLINANGSAKPFEVGSGQGSTDFANGKAAMWIQGPWMAESILKAQPDFEFGVAPLPVSNNPAGTMINLATSTSLAVSSSSENPEVAKDLVNFILDDKESSALFEELKFNPIATVHNYETFPWIQEATAYVSQGKAYLDLQMPQAVTDEQAKLLQSYYSKDVSKESFIKTMDATWAKAVKAAGQ